MKDDRLNLVEQLNQSFTVMASLATARRLLSKFPDCGGLRLNLATTRGWDIESIRPGVVEAEVFAAVDPSNANKLEKDTQKLRKRSNAKHRFVFFHCPGYSAGRQFCLEKTDSTVQVWALGRDEVM